MQSELSVQSTSSHSCDESCEGAVRLPSLQHSVFVVQTAGLPPADLLQHRFDSHWTSLLGLADVEAAPTSFEVPLMDSREIGG